MFDKKEYRKNEIFLLQLNIIFRHQNINFGTVKASKSMWTKNKDLMFIIGIK